MEKENSRVDDGDQNMTDDSSAEGSSSLGVRGYARKKIIFKTRPKPLGLKMLSSNKH